MNRKTKLIVALAAFAGVAVSSAAIAQSMQQREQDMHGCMQAGGQCPMQMQMHGKGGMHGGGHGMSERMQGGMHGGMQGGMQEHRERMHAQMHGQGGMHGGGHGSGPGGGHGSGHGPAGARGDQNASSIAFGAVNQKMHRDMDISFTGDADADFARGMIPHHQGAVDMARIVVAFGKDPEIRKLAEAIVKSQEAEIAFMREWLKKQGK